MTNFFWPLVICTAFLRLELANTLKIIGIDPIEHKKYMEEMQYKTARYNAETSRGSIPLMDNSMQNTKKNLSAMLDWNDNKALPELIYVSKEKWQITIQKKRIYKILHGVISILTWGLFLVALIFEGLTAQNCNSPAHGNTNECSNIIICCAQDSRSSLGNSTSGITNGCPYIQTCSDISPPYLSSSLSWDVYFRLSFGFTIEMLVLMSLHVLMVFEI
jgi:hypothetical protein